MDRRVTTQDISWFIDLDRNGQLDLDPPYQRRSVWSMRDRRFFLDTIFRGYPSPSIFLFKATKESGAISYEVVDGKQRLETILKFHRGDIAVAADFGDVELDGKKWTTLSTDRRQAFADYVLPVEFIRIVDGGQVNQVFDRLNRNSRRLERQELRHARYDGWFVNLVEEEAQQQLWRDLGVVTTARTKRMRDVQFISELLMVIAEDAIRGFDQDAIDDFYARHEEPMYGDVGLDEDKFRTGIASTKTSLSRMQDTNSCITAFAKTYGAFYTVWSVISLNTEQLPAAETIAERYDRFMRKVEELARQPDLDVFLRSQEAGAYTLAHRYFSNVVGASTDEAQRRARHDALLEALREEG